MIALQPPRIDGEYAAVNLAILGCLCLLSLAPFAFDVSHGSVDATTFGLRVPICPVRLETGTACPSCGLTRSLVALYDGNLGASRAFHTAGPVVASLLLLQILLRAVPVFWRSAWAAWFDLAQLLICGVVVRFVLFQA